MSETTIVYNGIQLKNVLTESIDQEVVPEGTGVNPIYVRVTVSCTGIIHNSIGNNELTIGVDPSGDLASGYNLIIDQLMQPGRNFAMYVGGTALFDVVPGMVRPGLANPNAGDTIPIRRTDVNHGPLPSVRVLGITSAHSMRVQFRIVLHLPYTDASGQSPGGAISFRFWISEDIDCDDWTTERTYQGTLRVRHLGHNVLTEIRQNFTFPVLVEGFQRKRISLQQRSNGLELDFTIRDKEVWAVPPAPATSWSGKHTMFSPQPGGVMLFSEVYLRVKADKHTPKQELLRLCQKVMDTKLHRLDTAADGRTFLQTFRVEDDFTDNEVKMSALVLLQPNATILWNIEKGNFAKPLNIGLPTYPSDFPTYDKDKAGIVFPTACIKGLFLAALQDPLHITGFPSDNENAQQITYAALACPHVVSEPDIAENSNQKISPEQKASAYNIYRMDSQTDKNWGVISLPVGKSSQGNATSVVLTMHKPTAQLRVKVDAERLQAWPTLPTPQEYANKLGATFTPMRTPIKAAAPVLSADYVKTLYRSSAEYVFAQDKEATSIPAGLMPYRVAGQDGVYVVPASAFSSTILFE